MPLLSDHDRAERTARYREIDRILSDLERRHGPRGACHVLAICLGIQAERAGACLRRLYTNTRSASGFYASTEGATDHEAQDDDWPEPDDAETAGAADHDAHYDDAADDDAADEFDDDEGVNASEPA